MDMMIDIETAATRPNALILTIAAQQFDPLGQGYSGADLYARVSVESQPDRDIDDSTIEWWAQQDARTREEAFGEEDRIPLGDVLDSLHKIAWRSNRIWMQGPHFDATILENAYRQMGRAQPWQFWKIRDSRTLLSLVPQLDKPPTTHHALEDCRKQIVQVQDALDYLKIRELI